MGTGWKLCILSAAAVGDGAPESRRSFCSRARGSPPPHVRRRRPQKRRQAGTMRAALPLRLRICRREGRCALWSMATCGLPIPAIPPIPPGRAQVAGAKGCRGEARHSAAYRRYAFSWQRPGRLEGLSARRRQRGRRRSCASIPPSATMKGFLIRSKGIANYFAAYPQIEKHEYYSVQLGNIYLITLDSSTFLGSRMAAASLAARRS